MALGSRKSALPGVLLTRIPTVKWGNKEERKKDEKKGTVVGIIGLGWKIGLLRYCWNGSRKYGRFFVNARLCGCV